MESKTELYIELHNTNNKLLFGTVIHYRSDYDTKHVLNDMLQLVDRFYSAKWGTFEDDSSASYHWLDRILCKDLGLATPSLARNFLVWLKDNTTGVLDLNDLDTANIDYVRINQEIASIGSEVDLSNYISRLKAVFAPQLDKFLGQCNNDCVVLSLKSDNLGQSYLNGNSLSFYSKHDLISPELQRLYLPTSLSQFCDNSMISKDIKHFKDELKHCNIQLSYKPIEKY